MKFGEKREGVKYPSWRVGDQDDESRVICILCYLESLLEV